MTGMEHAIEQVAKVMWEAPTTDFGGASERDAHFLARALADAGLIAPALLREEWRAYDPRTGGVAGMTDQAQAALTAHELAMDDTDNGIDSDWTVQHRLVSDWLPVGRAEGDGRAER